MRAKLTRSIFWKTAAAGVLAASMVFVPAPEVLGSAPAAVMPRAKPAPPPSTMRLSASDYRLFGDAFAAAHRGQWSRASQLAKRGKNPTARKLMVWYRLTKRSHLARIADIFAFVDQNPGWPRQTTLLRSAEERLRSSRGISNKQIVAWFSAREPITGEGKIRLGEAFVGLGQKAAGKSWIERGWIEHDYSAAREKEILQRHRKILPMATQERRLHRQLWSRSYRSARRSVTRVGADLQKLANARIKLMTRARDAKAAIVKVPPVHQNDVGLLFDQVRWNRRSGRPKEAWTLLMRAPADREALVRPEKWWIERKILARKAMEEGAYDVAYAITHNHGLESGADFADAEWLAGWMALRYLDKPKAALKHFQTLYVGVNYPVSKARAAYWAGRAAHAGGQIEEARRYYLAAASYPTTYYGQLAATATARGDNHLRLIDDAQRLSTKLSAPASEILEGIYILHELGENKSVETFVFHTNRQSKDPQVLTAMARLSQDLGYPNLGVRAAKSAARQNVQLLEASYPLIGLPAQSGKGGRVEDALLLGLSRQESEFKERAVSHAGAMGLMQLMPTTAKITARIHKLPYARHLLLDDPHLNLRVGSAHLSDLVDRFDGSYILAIAAYNAGAGRIRQWINRYGDPRDGTTDPVDWIELIPFSETRNYVQRVLENTQIYRNRIAGRATPLMIAADLARYRLRPRSLYAPHKPVIVSVVSKEPTSLSADPVAAQWRTIVEDDMLEAKAAFEDSRPVSTKVQPELPPSEVASVTASNGGLHVDLGRSQTAKVAGLPTVEREAPDSSVKPPVGQTAISTKPAITPDVNPTAGARAAPHVAANQPSTIASVDPLPAPQIKPAAKVGSSGVASQAVVRKCRLFIRDNTGGGTCADFRDIAPLVATAGPATPEGMLGRLPAMVGGAGDAQPVVEGGGVRATGSSETTLPPRGGQPATYLLTNPPSDLSGKIGDDLPVSGRNATYLLDRIELRGASGDLPADAAADSCTTPSSVSAGVSDGIPCEIVPTTP